MPEQYDADFAPPLAHLAEQAPVSISGVQGFKNAKKDGTVANAATRGGLNFVTGSNITLTVADDSANDEVDVTIAAAAAEYDVLTKVTTAVTVVSTTTLTDLINYEIAAGAIGTDKTIYARLHGHGLNNSGASRAFQLKVILGGTTLFDTGTAVYATPVGIGMTANAVRFSWVLDLFIAATAAANSQFMSGRLSIVRTTTGPATGYGSNHMYAHTAEHDGTLPFSSAGRTAVDMSSAQALQVQIAPEANDASLEWKMESAYVAVIG